MTRYFGTCILWIALFLVPGASLPTAPAQQSILDTRHFKITFDEHFTTLDISAHGPDTKWIAHTPWNGDFGDDVFDDPGPAGPFALTKDGLAITAHKDDSGKWHGGLICSMDKDGPGQHGFAQRYGYFEIDTKLPGGPGVWPAFWLIGTDKAQGVSEIDVIEYYGHANNEYHITEHYWVNGKDTLGAWHVVAIPARSLTDRFNSFGVWITPEHTRFYFNQSEVWSTPTPPEYDQPMYILANLAIGGGWPSGPAFIAAGYEYSLYPCF